MSRDIYLKLSGVTAGEVYQEIVKPQHSDHPTARAIVDLGKRATLVKESEITGVSPKNSPVLENILRLSNVQDPQALPQIPNVRGQSRNLKQALSL